MPPLRYHHSSVWLGWRRSQQDRHNDNEQNDEHRSSSAPWPLATERSDSSNREVIRLCTNARMCSTTLLVRDELYRRDMLEEDGTDSGSLDPSIRGPDRICTYPVSATRQ